jgi:hypothetical protein
VRRRPAATNQNDVPTAMAAWAAAASSRRSSTHSRALVCRALVCRALLDLSSTTDVWVTSRPPANCRALMDLSSTTGVWLTSRLDATNRSYLPTSSRAPSLLPPASPAQLSRPWWVCARRRRMLDFSPALIQEARGRSRWRKG